MADRQANIATKTYQVDGKREGGRKKERDKDMEMERGRQTCSKRDRLTETKR